ncbi:MAG: trypsin-like peptidase domain-containing protein [Planctomycetota bacterium]
MRSTRDDLSRIEEVVEPVEGQVEYRWRRIVGPTVQLAGDTTVGSGVVLRSTPNRDGEGYETQVLTARHVVRDILADKLDPEDKTVPVTIYPRAARPSSAPHISSPTTRPLDAALLLLDDDKPVANGATLASRSYLASRHIFHSIYAVGCPLGNDPIPTRGEISDLDHFIDGSTYWMISAPTYIGNSGGGIYDGEKNHLMGLFSKIYTHGNLRPTIVPHMGLVSPLALVYQWLEDEGIAKVIDEGDTAVIQLIGE